MDQDVKPTSVSNEPQDSTQIPAPAIDPTPAGSTVHEPNSSVTLVLQWLTYSFWGWLLLATISNTSLVVNYILNPATTDTSGLAPYSLAGLLVLLIVAIVTDTLYQKREPQRKTGGASAIMAIHAVIFALCGIGFLIFAIFMAIGLATSVGTDLSEMYVSITTYTTMTILYAATLLRTINPARAKSLSRIFTYSMATFGIILAVTIIAGPLMNDMRSRDDRMITQSLSKIQDGVDSYVYEKHRLPNSLSDIEYSGTSEQVVTNQLVTIEPKPSADINTDRATNLRYSLCAHYTTKTESNSKAPELLEGSRDQINDIDSIYSVRYHPKGKTCYKQWSHYSAKSTTPAAISGQDSTTYDQSN